MGLLDFLWFSFSYPLLYKKGIGHLMADKVDMFPAVLFYIVFAFGLYVFVLKPGFAQQFSVTRVLLLGMLLGFLAYATYNFTNQATLKDWPILVTIVDSIWGAVVSGVTATLVYVLTR
tara:strand:- start:167 stop:520 length:354 start_codon:yes stop_codon:yes gene_type:complete